MARKLSVNHVDMKDAVEDPSPADVRATSGLQVLEALQAGRIERSGIAHTMPMREVHEQLRSLRGIQFSHAGASGAWQFERRTGQVARLERLPGYGALS